eukprot:12265264-Alexandrium_andersonii.AAC.1
MTNNFAAGCMTSNSVITKGCARESVRTTSNGEARVQSRGASIDGGRRREAGVRGGRVDIPGAATRRLTQEPP